MPYATRRSTQINNTPTSKTPSRATNRLRSLSINQIKHNLNDEDDKDEEYENPRNKVGKVENSFYKCESMDSESLNLRLVRLDKNIKCNIGIKKNSQSTNNKFNLSHKKTPQNKKVLDLGNIAQESTRQKDTAINSRKRSLVQTGTCKINKKGNNQEWQSSDSEGDENLAQNVNKSPKRSKPTSFKQTPKSISISVNTPKSSRASAQFKKCITPLQSHRETNDTTGRLERKAKMKFINYNEHIDDEYESGDDSDKTVSIKDIDSEDDSDISISADDESDEIFDSPVRKQSNKSIIPGTPKTPSKSIKKVSMDTPTKSLAKMCLTPSVKQRTTNIVKPSTPLQEARIKLHVSVLPKSLPCREEQFNEIYTFLHTKLSDNTGGCIYISGVPGTGKTATVNEVIRCLKKSMNAGKLPNFEFVDINGMKLSEPRQAYVQIWKQLSNKQTTWEEAQKLLHKRFTNSKSKECMTLLLVDELDLLCTKRQDVVYNLLDWPSKEGAKLVVVTIANTMDLPERVLMGKVTSRLGLTRLTFPPYNFKQLEEIVVSRLRGYNAFGGETIQLVARKVAAVSGDARRALDICRRATEIAENSDREIVSMIDVKQAVDEMIASPKIQAIKHCSDLERVFLQAVCAEVYRTGIEEVVFKNVYLQLTPLCTMNGEKLPNVTEALGMCARLGSWRLLLCDHSRMDIHQRILLNVSTDDVQFAIKSIEV